MSAYDEIRDRTRDLEGAFYALLESCDAYLETTRRLLAAEEESGAPRSQLVHRLEQLSANVGRIRSILEDDALTILLPVLDRLFAIRNAEVGTDI